MVIVMVYQQFLQQALAELDRSENREIWLILLIDLPRPRLVYFIVYVLTLSCGSKIPWLTAICPQFRCMVTMMVYLSSFYCYMACILHGYFAWLHRYPDFDPNNEALLGGGGGV